MNIRRLKRCMPLVMLAVLTLSVLLPAVSTGAVSSTSSPPDPGLSRDEGFAAIDRYVAAEMHAQHIPGLALGIVQGDQIVHLKGFGVADTSGGVVTPQTPFPIGKVSKTFTALAVMQLVEAGNLNLDTPVQICVTARWSSMYAVSARCSSRILSAPRMRTPARTPGCWGCWFKRSPRNPTQPTCSSRSSRPLTCASRSPLPPTHNRTALLLAITTGSANLPPPNSRSTAG